MTFLFYRPAAFDQYTISVGLLDCWTMQRKEDEDIWIFKAKLESLIADEEKYFSDLQSF